jgi:hypothetical protein
VWLYTDDLVENSGHSHLTDGPDRQTSRLIHDRIWGDRITSSASASAVTRRAENRRFSRRPAPTFRSRLPPKRGRRSLTGAPPGCSTVQIHWFEKRLFLKDFFAAENQWRREWDSNPRRGLRSRYPWQTAFRTAQCGRRRGPRRCGSFGLFPQARLRQRGDRCHCAGDGCVMPIVDSLRIELVAARGARRQRQ